MLSLMFLVRLLLQPSRMTPQSYRKSIAVVLLSLLFVSLHVGPLHADERGCEILYTETLRKAQQALIENRREEAVNFLLKAISISDSCASLRQQPQFRRQGEETVLYLLPPLGLTWDTV